MGNNDIMDAIFKYGNLLFTAFVYWAAAIRGRERNRVESENMQHRISLIERDMLRMDEKKADKELLSMFMKRFDRLEEKIDRLSEKK